MNIYVSAFQSRSKILKFKLANKSRIIYIAHPNLNNQTRRTDASLTPVYAGHDKEFCRDAVQPPGEKSLQRNQLNARNQDHEPQT